MRGSKLTSLLLGHTDSASATASGLGVLSADSQTPRMTEAAMHADLFQMLQILTQLVIQVVGEELAELAVLAVFLTIQEPIGDLVRLGVLHNCHQTLQVSLVQLTSTIYQQILGNVGIRGHTACSCRFRPCGR